MCIRDRINIAGLKSKLEETFKQRRTESNIPKNTCFSESFKSEVNQMNSIPIVSGLGRNYLQKSICKQILAMLERYRRESFEKNKVRVEVPGQILSLIDFVSQSVSYTHLTLPTIYSV
eukprot:TRINITY_DN25875_c0_g1_i1.p1 TRINITY_DN25875_c0_g1~~TRINITY_DN25875_c0_g1_i1.p1  ORF type:complete len:137 (+),score=32.12 TRINITY_DN25875_c0_g1_i1:59-412(+)